MKDVELLILKAFTYSIAQQATLPSTLLQKTQEIAVSLKTRIAELDQLAMTSVLQPSYSWAYNYLTSNAAERGMGADFVAADYDEDGPAHEPGNIVSAPERIQLDKDRQLIQSIDSRLGKDNSDEAARALSSNNLSEALQKFLDA